MPTLPPTPTLAVLAQVVENLDEKHSAAHQRLRFDLSDGLSDVNGDIDRLWKAHNLDHDMLMQQTSQRESQTQLSTSRAVVLAAAIAGGFRVIEVVLTQLLALAHHVGSGGGGGITP